MKVKSADWGGPAKIAARAKDALLNQRERGRSSRNGGGGGLPLCSDKKKREKCKPDLKCSGKEEETMGKRHVFYKGFEMTKAGLKDTWGSHSTAITASSRLGRKYRAQRKGTMNSKFAVRGEGKGTGVSTLNRVVRECEEILG